ncbi:MAG: PH domain-containing protein [Candidatus Micrarchaeota archaeon]|nr:PH domain-containing protein [Candidatus Micrarchaeota archaeon]
MQIDTAELMLAKKVLWPDEEVEGTIKQRRFMPGGSLITPTTVVVTDKRLIIINRASLGFRQDYEVVPYNAIMSVRLEHGIITSTVFIRVLGYDTDRGLLGGSGKQEGEIDGLKNKDATELTDYLNKKLEKRFDAQANVDKEIQGQEAHIDNGVGSYIYCNNCGTKNKSSAKFCSKCGKPLSGETT